MPESNFIDHVRIYCRSGKGGRGSMHLHHAKYNYNGGPDGGNGGRGGHIILRGNRNLWTLLHLRYQKHIMAGNGGDGGPCRSSGKDGNDVYIEVPCGTVVYNAESGKYICDVTSHGQEVILLKGGRGGLGNFEFRTSTNQAPRYAQPGEPMQEMQVIMQLKLLADVGLVGFPNAGKSTLLSSVSAARPKIANYPFTTLEPSLGIVSYRNDKSFVMADIPGIIEGASEGRGIGLRFLSLCKKSRILAITKCDMIDEELEHLLKEELPDDLPVIFISSVSGKGLQELKDTIWKSLNSNDNTFDSKGDDHIVHKDLNTHNINLDLLYFEDDEDINRAGTEQDTDIIYV